MERISDAFKLAITAHDGQKRKLDGLPYVLHVCEVAQLVGDMTKDEDTLIAAILHDTVEDTGIVIEDVDWLFGPNVAAMVAGMTEDKMRDRPADETWKVRKEHTLNELRQNGDLNVKMILLADKYSNLSSMRRYKLKHGEDIWGSFNERDPRNHWWYYNEIGKIVGEDLSKESIYKDYLILLDEVFGEYSKKY